MAYTPGEVMLANMLYGFANALVPVLATTNARLQNLEEESTHATAMQHLEPAVIWDNTLPGTYTYVDQLLAAVTINSVASALHVFLESYDHKWMNIYVPPVCGIPTHIRFRRGVFSGAAGHDHAFVDIPAPVGPVPIHLDSAAPFDPTRRKVSGMSPTKSIFGSLVYGGSAREGYLMPHESIPGCSGMLLVPNRADWTARVSAVAVRGVHYSSDLPRAIRNERDIVRFARAVAAHGTISVLPLGAAVDHADMRAAEGELQDTVVRLPLTLHPTRANIYGFPWNRPDWYLNERIKRVLGYAVHHSAL